MPTRRSRRSRRTRTEDGGGSDEQEVWVRALKEVIFGRAKRQDPLAFQGMAHARRFMRLADEEIVKRFPELSHPHHFVLMGLFRAQLIARVDFETVAFRERYLFLLNVSVGAQRMLTDMRKIALSERAVVLKMVRREHRNLKGQIFGALYVARVMWALEYMGYPVHSPTPEEDHSHGIDLWGTDPRSGARFPIDVKGSYKYDFPQDRAARVFPGKGNQDQKVWPFLRERNLPEVLLRVRLRGIRGVEATEIEHLARGLPDVLSSPVRKIGVFLAHVTHL